MSTLAFHVELVGKALALSTRMIVLLQSLRLRAGNEKTDSEGLKGYRDLLSAFCANSKMNSFFYSRKEIKKGTSLSIFLRLTFIEKKRTQDVHCKI